MEKHTLPVKGMESPHCVMVVKNVISRQEGVILESIEPGKAEVSLDETVTSKQNLVAAIEKMGYKVAQ